LTQKAPRWNRDIPTLEGKGYRVVGMGYVCLDFDKKEYRGMGEMKNDYGKGINKYHRGLVKATLERAGWTCFK
jgi:hypothetical protein